MKGLYIVGLAIIFLFVMHLPEKVYVWLVDLQIIDNQGELDPQGNVCISKVQTSNFANGYLMGELLKKYATKNQIPAPQSLAAIKGDHSRSTKLTNWNFIWLALPELGLQFDPRIKQLILQGEESLICEVIRQLYDHDTAKSQPSDIQIKLKVVQKLRSGGQVDIKKMDLGKDPQTSVNSLQLLVLLLRQSLGMTLEQILGLFTNQNKYLALVIITGMNQNFQPIVLFFTLLNKHTEKLKEFYRQSQKDGQAFLHALKPGFMSKCEKVAQLTLTLFHKFQNLFDWFVGEGGKCVNTFMLGIKRHAESLRDDYWRLLLQIISERQLQFFTKHYEPSFRDEKQLIEMTRFIVVDVAQSYLKDQLENVGVLDNWLEVAVNLDRNDLEAQIFSFQFIGEMMAQLPDYIEKNQEYLTILTRDWSTRSLIHFSGLANEIIAILQTLGAKKSQMARKVYSIVSQIVKIIGSGDKRDYLVEQFLPLISKFPNIPSEYFISNLTSTSLSHSELLLICQSIETVTHSSTLIQIGNFLKKLFIESPLINFYIAPLIREVAEKIISKREDGNYCYVLIEEVLYAYAVTFVKYKPKHKTNNQLYFGRSGNPEAISKDDEMDLRVSKKWKELYLNLAHQLIALLSNLNEPEVTQSVRQKVLKVDSYIKFHNNKVPSKELRDFLFDKCSIMIQDKSDNKLKVTISEVDPIQKYVKITSEERRDMEEREHAFKQKKYLDFKRKKVSKELEKSNLMLGQVSVAQISDQGVFQHYVQQPKQLKLMVLEELEARDLEAVDMVLKKYHKVLRHLFLLYTGTKFSSHNTPELIEDTKKRKETLTSVELSQFLKDYRKMYLTSISEVNAMVRDINIKLLNKRDVSELDFKGFQMYIIQFCYNNMTIPHEITTNTTTVNNLLQKNSMESKKLYQNLQNQPISVILKEFFRELKGTFVTRKETIQIFQDFEDIIIPKQQEQQVNRLTSELEANPYFILPAGYKKMVEKTQQLSHHISPHFKGIPQSYQIAFSALDYIFSKSSLGLHVMENLAVQKDHYKIKCIGATSPQKMAKQRAMSTLVNRSKSPLVKKNVVFPKETIMILKSMSEGDKVIAQQVAILIEDMLDKICIPQTKLQEAKVAKKVTEEISPKRRAKSSFKVQKQEPLRIRALTRKQEEKEEFLKKQKEAQKKRRQHIQKFLQQQKLKLIEKKKKEQEDKLLKKKQEQEKLAQKRANTQKFKPFHQSQVQKIKKMEESALLHKNKQKQDELQQKQKQIEMYHHLKTKIEQHSKIRNQTRREIQKQIAELFSSEPIKSTFRDYEPNLRGLYDFLINQTHHSLTEKKHNNEIVFQTWKYFLLAFELMPLIIDSKEGVHLFKTLTKAKEVPKDSLVGLNFKDFQQALFKMIVKYKGFFNAIGQRIKQSKSSESEVPNSSNLLQKEQNQFNADDLKIQTLIKKNHQGKNQLNEYGDISKVNGNTLKGLIHYLKVPRSKVGQVQRFRQILLNKPPLVIHKSERLKEKLKEQYSLLQSPKKVNKSVLLDPKRKVQSGAEQIEPQ